MDFWACSVDAKYNAPKACRYQAGNVGLVKRVQLVVLDARRVEGGCEAERGRSSENFVQLCVNQRLSTSESHLARTHLARLMKETHHYLGWQGVLGKTI